MLGMDPFSLITGGLGFVENLMNMNQVDKWNQIMMDRADGVANQVQDLDLSGLQKYTDPNFMASQMGSPDFIFGGNYNRGLSPRRPGQRALNFDQMFDPEYRSADKFNQAYDGGYDYDFLSSGIAKGLNREKSDPMERARQAGSFYPDAQFGEYLSSQLEGIGSGSRARESVNRNNIISQGLASGKTMEDLGGALDSASYGEQLGRAGQATQARASQEQLRTQSDLQRAGAQSQALGQQSALNAALAQAMAQEQSQIGRQAGAEQLDVAKTTGQFSLADLGLDQRANEFGYQATRDFMLDKERSGYSGRDAAFQAIQAELSRLGLLGGLKTGTNFNVPQSHFAETLASLRPPPKEDDGSSWSVGTPFFSIGG